MAEIRYEESQAGVQASYDEIYRGADEIRHTETFYAWLISLANPRPGEIFLDVACGEGDITRLARARRAQAFGCDLSYSAVRALDDGRGSLAVANGETLPYADGAFDVVTNIGSLEHYIDPARGVREMARVLAPDGRALVLLPNLFSVVNMLYARRHGRTADDGYQPIQRLAARFEWQELLEDNGLQVRRTVKYEQILPKTRAGWRILLKRPKNLLWLALTPVMPLNWANSFVFICSRP